MTIEYANEARALTARNKWTIETLLIAVENAAVAGNSTVDVAPTPSQELIEELCSRGFTVNVNKSDYDNDCRISW
jgi:hypothetical protein